MQETAKLCFWFSFVFSYFVFFFFELFSLFSVTLIAVLWPPLLAAIEYLVMWVIFSNFCSNEIVCGPSSDPLVAFVFVVAAKGGQSLRQNFMTLWKQHTEPENRIRKPAKERKPKLADSFGSWWFLFWLFKIGESNYPTLVKCSNLFDREKLRKVILIKP